MRSRWPAFVLVGVALAVLPACSADAPNTGSPPQRSPSSSTTKPSHVYVAVGASDTLGVGATAPLVEGWPQVFHREHLAPETRLVVVGIPGATVATALTGQLPGALAEQPTLVTAWLSVNDLLSGVPPATYERQLGDLVHALRRGGSTTVLLGNTPPHWALPRSIGTERVDAYNTATARVGRREGAVLVDLHAAALDARARGDDKNLVSADGLHPSTAGHRAIAGAFARALASTNAPERRR